MMKSSQVEEWYQLPPLYRSNVSKRAPDLQIVGKCHNKKWIKKARDLNAPRENPLVEYNIKDHFISQGWRLDDHINNKSILDPDQLSNALLNYGVSRSLNPDLSTLDRACSVALKDLGNPGHATLSPMPMHASVLKQAIKLDKSSGIPELTSKLDAWDKDFELAKGILSGERSWMPCICLNRIQHKGTGPKTRLVWCYGLSMTILEARFARPIIASFLARRGCTPMAFGLLKYQMSSTLLPIENSRFRISLDYSQFDATVPTYLIRKAFGILASYLDLSDPSDHEGFEKCVQYFINTPILMPNGNIYRKNRGIPSGSYFTQLIGSIVNYICLQYAHIKMTGNSINSQFVRVLGDDSVIGCANYVEPEVLSKYIGELGVIVHPEKSDTSRLGESVPFLGVRWKGGFPSRDPFDIIQRLAYPERYRKIAVKKHLTLFVAYLNTCLECWPLFMSWRHDILSWTLERYGDEPISVPDFLLSHSVHTVESTSGTRLMSGPKSLMYLGMLF